MPLDTIPKLLSAGITQTDPLHGSPLKHHSFGKQFLTVAEKARVLFLKLSREYSLYCLIARSTTGDFN